MATFTSSDPVIGSSLEGLNSFLDLMHTSLISVGCLQTSDEGQLNLFDEYPEYSSSSNTYYLGYRTYEINDKYSVDTPIYFTIRFSLVKPRTVINPVAAISVGFATDGFGNIIGPTAGNYSLPWAVTNISSGDVNPQPQAFTAVCKQDGYLFCAVGVGHAHLSSGSGTGSRAPIAAFFVISRPEVSDNISPHDGVCLLNNIPQTRPVDMAQIRSSWIFKSPEISDPYRTNITSLGALDTVNGQKLAIPITPHNSQFAYVDNRVVTVYSSGLTANSIIELSLDDIHDRPYLCLLSPSSTTGVTNRVPWVVDTRNRYEGSLAFWFE